MNINPAVQIKIQNEHVDESKSKKRKLECAEPSIQINKRKSVQQNASKKSTIKRIPRKSQLPLITPPDLSQYAICWVKIRGYKDWPGVIENHVNGGYEIHFFGDYTTSIVSRSKITNFYEGFSLFKHTFDAPKLKKAIQEACICLMSDPSPSSCLVCSILKKTKF